MGSSGRDEDPIEKTNLKTDEAFIQEHLQPRPATYSISLTSVQNVNLEDLKTCLALIEETSKTHYKASSKGWKPRSKLGEMKSPELRYIIVRDAEGEIRGFTSLMPTYEEFQPVIYCYEIHLKPELRGTGLGRHLMGFLERVATHTPTVGKVMLTCFVQNSDAFDFYKKLGFDVDEISPKPRVFRDGREVGSDYVIMNWDRTVMNSLPSNQFSTIMNSTAWHSLERGTTTVDEACKEFAELINTEPMVVKKALDKSQLSLRVNTQLVDTIRDLKCSIPDLKIYVMSNISREHFEITQGLDLPWSSFDRCFASGIVGMRKPDLCFYDHVIQEIGLPPDQMIMIDDSNENICSARARGMHGILVNKSLKSVSGALRSLLEDPLERGERYLKGNAKNHHSSFEGHESVVVKDNFAQHQIWELTGDEDLIYLRWPDGRIQGTDVVRPEHCKASANGDRQYDGGAHGQSHVHPPSKNALWDYFIDGPVMTTHLPPDADTTAIAYLSMPERYLTTAVDPKFAMDEMAKNLDHDGIMQMYFDAERPRTGPEVCCNILRMFHRFGYDTHPAAKKTEDYVVCCLDNSACLDGNRHYTAPETFLYFVARLHSETRSEALRRRLRGIKAHLEGRLNEPTNPLALALRLFACQILAVEPTLYRRDLERLLALQDEDGGWPAGQLCCLGRTRVPIGNRGLTTALALSAAPSPYG
ncbi:hypothetical protein E8E14_000141 [Neopestalotiopsis sp. 37M]|nr:hypothetical protein E8E14_000141 [Neopestalotiopsis sp. 37M]